MQKRFTRVLCRLGGINCKERLGKVELFSMESWRLKEVNKIVRLCQNLSRWLEISKTREHSFKVRWTKFKDVQDQYFYIKGGECL